MEVFEQLHDPFLKDEKAKTCQDMLEAAETRVPQKAMLPATDDDQDTPRVEVVASEDMLPSLVRDSFMDGDGTTLVAMAQARWTAASTSIALALILTELLGKIPRASRLTVLPLQEPASLLFDAATKCVHALLPRLRRTDLLPLIAGSAPAD